MTPDAKTRLAAWGGATALHLGAGALMLRALTGGTMAHGSAGHSGLRMTVLAVRLERPTDRPTLARGMQARPAPVPILSNRIDDADLRPERESSQAPTSSGSGAVGAPPAAAVIDTAASAAMVDAFRSALAAHIRRFLAYPMQARRDRTEGTVRLAFVVDRAGHVANLWVVQSSGEPLLDADALAATRRAEPMPPVPADLPDRIEVTLPIPYTLG